MPAAVAGVAAASRVAFGLADDSIPYGLVSEAMFSLQKLFEKTLYYFSFIFDKLCLIMD
jgi:hypothetical protein